MSANYRSKLYHKSILLKPANTQLFEIFCHNNSVYSFLCWQSREITIRPTLKWLAKFKRGLTRFRTWSHTRWWCFCFFIIIFFHDGSVTHICAHTCTQTQTCCRPRLEGSVGPRYDLIRMRHAGSATFENPMVEDRWAGSWLQYPSPACLPSPCQTPIPPKIKAGEESDKMSEPSGSSDIVHPCALAVSSNDALLKCQTN